MKKEKEQKETAKETAKEEKQAKKEKKKQKKLSRRERELMELSPEELFELEKKRKLKYSIISYALGVAAILILVLFIAEWAGSSAWFTYITRFFEGLFSVAAFGIPVILMYCAYFLPKIIEEKKYKWNLALAISLLITASIIVGLVFNHGEVRAEVDEHTSEFVKGVYHTGGGLVGAYISFIFSKALSIVGAWVLTIALAILEITFLVGLTLGQVGKFFVGLLKKIWAPIGQKIKKKFGRKGKKKKEKAAEDDEVFVAPAAPEEGARYYHKPLTDNNPYAAPAVTDGSDKRRAALPAPDEDEDEDETVQQVLPRPEVIARPDAPDGWGRGAQSASADGKVKPRAGAASGSIDLDEIFNSEEEKGKGSPVILDVEDDEEEEEEILLPPKVEKNENKDAMKVKRTTLMSVVPEGEEEEEDKKMYTFPPVGLLKAIPGKQSDPTEELQNNATRLVDTLRSFKVRTKVVAISRGPTITRYELQPEEGIRVRQIANLVDDIQLNLAASGVRIEAPIPGKSAVGVEVPNKERETVYLRTLIDDDRFEQSTAKLTAAIGVDVAGDPIYVDLAKMPHLLIAGTTGSGKSVCMNCLILSILYKSSPDEVKMIMIDPKKVEFNVYNGLPHLIVPVMSNSKKAAGALSWAVSEMEHRYEQIEQVGVRDIKNYNKVTANDPERAFMPQLVIIIDELADLMLTAPGEVEESICRIAQKGRACGMHLIIGTQRPSVDVITGLIKANVPSRVAFTVSSQVDSRTIIDIAGAEKLIGKGDMLFAPIGAMKPMRLQGAFVSDDEVEAVTNFIINHSAEAVYDDKVIKDIEKEAELCGSKGKKQAVDVDASAEGDGESDPMLKAAIDLAVESGKISTSLIQRRLSLGYGRAAKLIDEMEKRGIVSPPEGQKPRSVLITASEWNEICLRSESI